MLIDDDGSGERRGVGGLLLGPLHREELARVDGEPDGEEQRHEDDGHQEDRLAAFALGADPGARLRHRWMKSCDPPRSVIWNAPPRRYWDGSGTNGAVASTVTRWLRWLSPSG